MQPLTVHLHNKCGLSKSKAKYFITPELGMIAGSILAPGWFPYHKHSVSKTLLSFCYKHENFFDPVNSYFLVPFGRLCAISHFQYISNRCGWKSLRRYSFE